MYTMSAERKRRKKTFLEYLELFCIFSRVREKVIELQDSVSDFVDYALVVGGTSWNHYVQVTDFFPSRAHKLTTFEKINKSSQANVGGSRKKYIKIKAKDDK